MYISKTSVHFLDFCKLLRLPYISEFFVCFMRYCSENTQVMAVGLVSSHFPLFRFFSANKTLGVAGAGPPIQSLVLVPVTSYRLQR